MAEEIHEHGHAYGYHDHHDSGTSVIVGAMIFLVAVLVVLFWGMPFITGTTGSQIYIPDNLKIEVNTPNQ